MSNTSAQEMTYSIPLGRRIGEIMEEKGDAFSIRAFASRLSMNREILRVIIQGDRTVTPSEFEKIANGLHVRPERIKRLDTYKIENELNQLLQSIKNPKRAVFLAEELSSVAIGMTERCMSLNNLGRAYFIVQRYEEAHTNWLDAYNFAKKILGKYGESELLSKIMMNLMISYTVRKEYSNLEQVLKEVENIFQSDPFNTGVIYYTKAKIAENKGDNRLAKENAYLSLQSYMETTDKKSIGKAELTAAHYEYKERNFFASKELLERAIVNLQVDLFFQLLAVKEYAKSLLRLKMNDAAVKVIEEYLPQSSEYDDIAGKLNVLLAVATGNVEYAENVVDNSKTKLQVRYLACKYLMNYYKKQRDAQSLLAYYEKADNLSRQKYEFLDEEEL